MQKDILTDRSAESQDSTKDFLIIAAAKLFAKRGYYGTSIADITEACRLTKSSYFHHFATKELIGIAVVDYLTKYISAHIFPPIYNTSLENEERLKQLLKNIRNEIIFQEKPLLGFLCIELISASEIFTKQVRQYADLWINQLAFAIKDFHSNPEKVAYHSLSYLQGCAIVENIYQKPVLADECCQHLFRLWTNSSDIKLD